MQPFTPIKALGAGFLPRHGQFEAFRRVLGFTPAEDRTITADVELHDNKRISKQDQIESTIRPFVRRESINWISVIAFTVFHVGAIVALFFFTWPAFFVALVLYWISLSLGIGMGYHRLLTHRSYKPAKWIEYLLATCGTLALEGGPMFWVATHRVHHQFSDRDGDPHTPCDGKWWSH